MKAAGGNDVAGKDAAARVAELCGRCRKIAAALRVGRYRRRDRSRRALLRRALVGDEDERPVAPQWAARRAAELMPLERRHGIGEEVARVQRLVTQELEHCAVKFVRSRFGDGVHQRAGVASFLGAIRTGLQTELLERVG